MMSNSIPWMGLAMQSPYYLGLLFALFMCLTKKRQNPRGAAYLGLAIFFAVAAMLPTIILLIKPDFLFDVSSPSSMASARFMILGMNLYITIMQGLGWVMVALGIFAQERHADINWTEPGSLNQ